MNYCSLDDAFQTVGDPPVPGCNDTAAARQARKEERKKARRAKIPVMTPLSVEAKEKDPDPDRPVATLPEVEAFETDHSSELFRSHHNSVTNQNPYPKDDYRYHKGDLGEYTRSEIANHYMAVPVNGSTITAPKKFFGAQGPSDENFADYVPDEKDYRLQPDFTKAFQQSGTDRAGASPVLPTPFTQMAWKPITPNGAQTSYIEHLPPPSGKYHNSIRNALENGDISMDDVMKKLDKLFAKLEDMNHSTPEQLTSELLMFISSGIFVLFIMDMMVKRA
jgi:hypothetical protein